MLTPLKRVKTREIKPPKARAISDDQIEPCFLKLDLHPFLGPLDLPLGQLVDPLLFSHEKTTTTQLLSEFSNYDRVPGELLRALLTGARVMTMSVKPHSALVTVLIHDLAPLRVPRTLWQRRDD